MQFDGRLGRSTVGNTHYHSHRHLTIAIQLETIFLEVAAMGSARRHHALCQSRAWQCGWQRLLSKHTFVQTQEAAHLLLDFFNRLGTEGFALFGQFVISTHSVLNRAFSVGKLQVDLTRTGAKHVLASKTHLVDMRQRSIAAQPALHPTYQMLHRIGRTGMAIGGIILLHAFRCTQHVVGPLHFLHAFEGTIMIDEIKKPIKHLEWSWSHAQCHIGMVDAQGTFARNPLAAVTGPLQFQGTSTITEEKANARRLDAVIEGKQIRCLGTAARKAVAPDVSGIDVLSRAKVIHGATVVPEDLCLQTRAQQVVGGS